MMKVKRNSPAPRHTLPAIVLLLASGGAAAEKLVMPAGMGGVPDIGAIPCEVFNNMTRIANPGTRHSLITWAAGYLQAITGKSLQEVVDAADGAGQPWTYARLGDSLAAFCAANPTSGTRDAVASVAKSLGAAPAP